MIRIVAVSVALVAVAGSAFAESPVDRGAYLVTGVMNCGNCHSPKGPPAAVAGKDLSGGLSWDLPPFKVTAANITQDKETGIGSWSATDIKKLLRTGLRPNGTAIAAIMPTGFYGIITETDMDAIAAYLHTVAPVSNVVPAPVYRFAAPPQTFPGTERPYTEADMGDRLKRGFYLASIGHCMECHTPELNHHRLKPMGFLRTG